MKDAAELSGEVEAMLAAEKPDYSKIKRLISGNKNVLLNTKNYIEETDSVMEESAEFPEGMHPNLLKSGYGDIIIRLRTRLNVETFSIGIKTEGAEKLESIKLRGSGPFKGAIQDRIERDRSEIGEESKEKDQLYLEI